MAGGAVTYKGIILKSREYKDKDRIISFLTGDHGLVDICVKGTGKIGSHNAFASVPYMLCEIVAAESHGFMYMRSGSIIESNSKIHSDLDALMCGAHFADLLVDMSGQSDNSREAYELACYTYYHLANNTVRWKLITAAFNWRVLSILGFTVEYAVTNDTGSSVTDNDLYCLSANGGEIYSGKHSGEQYMMLSGVAVKALNYIAACDIKELYGITGSESLSDSLFEFTLKYLSYQLDKDYKGRFMI
ncbi:DNA replication and repair protein RecO [Ruminococcaceae bacterium YRB3002]|nr:DNA replication and repair protein RecO [Ruminococcaceae bacterium YRB3002]